MKLTLAIAVICLAAIAHGQQAPAKAKVEAKKETGPDDKQLEGLIKQVEARFQVIFGRAEKSLNNIGKEVEQKLAEGKEVVTSAQNLVQGGLSKAATYLPESLGGVSANANVRVKRDTVDNLQGGVNLLGSHFKNDVTIIVRFFWTLLENTEDILRRINTEVFSALSVLPFFGLFLGGDGSEQVLGGAAGAAGGAAGAGGAAAAGLGSGLGAGLGAGLGSGLSGAARAGSGLGGSLGSGLGGALGGAGGAGGALGSLVNGGLGLAAGVAGAPLGIAKGVAGAAGGVLSSLAGAAGGALGGAAGLGGGLGAGLGGGLGGGLGLGGGIGPFGISFGK